MFDQPSLLATIFFFVLQYYAHQWWRVVLDFLPRPALLELEHPIEIPSELQRDSSTGCVICKWGQQGSPNELRACSRCKTRLYCGPVCQSKDWAVHKLLCFSKHKFEHPPAADMRRVIVFDLLEPEVKFAWVKIKATFDGDRIEYGDQLRGTMNVWVQRKPSFVPYRYNQVRGRALEPPIVIFRDPSVACLNTAVNGWLGDTSVAPPWPGPLVAFTMDVEKKRVLNTSIRDIRDVADAVAEMRRPGASVEMYAAEF